LVGVFRQAIRLTQQEYGLAWQVIEQRGQRFPSIIPHSLKDSQLAAGRECDGIDLLAGNLRERIEMTQRLEFIAKKFQPHRPGTGHRINIQNAAAQREFALLDVYPMTSPWPVRLEFF